MAAKRKSTKNSLHISLPATSANLGPAFDAAALAMDFYIKLRAQPAEEFSITATGRDREICGRVENHLDNASACWMGGLTVARMSGEADAQVACIRPKGKWPLLLAVPEQSLPTEEARRVLPSQYSRADAITNVQNSMLLLAAFTQGRPDLLAAALDDRIHQPYRSALCPLLPSLQQLKGKLGILGSALSGAGPSVLIFLDPRASVLKIRKHVASHLAAQGLAAELISTSITLRGGRL